MNVTHSENHWSNEDKAKELFNNILIPYVKRVRGELNLRSTKEWVLIADVFKGQWTEAVKQLIYDNHGKMVPVPNNMTSYLQHLDLTVNRSCTSFLRNQAQKWYSEQVQAQIVNGINADKVSVDLRISVVKPLHAKWVTQFYDYMQSQQGNHYKRLGTIGDRRRLERDAKERGFSCVFVILSTQLLPCLFYALYYIIEMAKLLLGLFERCAKLKLSEY